MNSLTGVVVTPAKRYLPFSVEWSLRREPTDEPLEIRFAEAVDDFTIMTSFCFMLRDNNDTTGIARTLCTPF